MAVFTEWAASSVTGLVRQGNEDSAYAGTWLQAVADGMGGHVAGEIASAAAITGIAGFDAETVPELLTETAGHAVTAANTAIRRRTELDPALKTMGTTLTAMFWSGHAYVIAHIGDSRAYRLRGGQLTRLTEDHSLRNLVAGTAASAILGPVVSRFLDGRPDRSPDISLRQARPGDRYLLCSDGLSAVVPDGAISAVLSPDVSRAGAVRQLTALAELGSGPDNITVVVIDVLAEPAAAPTAPTVLGAAAAVALP